MFSIDSGVAGPEAGKSQTFDTKITESFQVQFTI